MRWFYIKGNDKAIEQILKIYFSAIKDHFWANVCIEKGTVLVRSVGISALFQFLRKKLMDMPKINKENIEKLRDLDKQRENQRQKYLSLLEDAKRVKQQQLDCVR
ncbi:hypothetical protein PJ217_24105, partial [Escherichia coli]|nr:hypothetical protein [Escherichia coli]MDA7229707.1 hypothetical protein [Escherichia coli]